MTALVCAWYMEYTRHIPPFTDRSVTANQSLLSSWSLVLHILHKLKHKIGILGLEESYNMAEEYEKQLKKNKKILTFR